MSTVEDFLKKGKLLSPEVVEDVSRLNDKEKESLMEAEELVIKKENITELKALKPEIIETDYQEKKELHVSEFTEFYLDRFEFLKGEIKERLEGEEISSINNITSGETCIIGMVRDVGDDVVIEDKTGELVLKTNQSFVEDEVIGVKGKVIKNDGVVMSPSKIIFPDVPLGKEVRALDDEKTALFVTKVDERVKDFVKKEGVDYIFSVEEPDDQDLGAVFISDEPGELSDIDPVRCRLGNMVILVHDGSSVDKAQKTMGLERTQAMIALLKKRHLDPVEMHSLNDRYLIREVPDIVHVSGEDSTKANYKGVTLLSTTEDRAFTVNLKTREIDEVEL